MDTKTLNKLARLDDKIENSKRVRNAIGAAFIEVAGPQKLSESAANKVALRFKNDLESAFLAIICNSMPKAAEGLRGQDIIDSCSATIWGAAFDAVVA